jgi:hypothetical protein
VIVERFGIAMCFKNLSQWTERAKIVVKWREVAANYSSFNITFFDYDAIMYDVILNVNPVTIRAVVITLLCMAVVCLFFIPSVCSVIIASVCIVSISVCKLYRFEVLSAHGKSGGVATYRIFLISHS